MRLVARTLETIDPPVGVSEVLRAETQRNDMLDVAQGAPAYPTAPTIVHRIREMVGDADAARYTDVRGIPELREALARDLSTDYQSEISADHVLITAGANQAFCLVASALAESGDEVIISVPYYFNHDMWVRLEGLRPVYVDTSPSTGQAGIADIAESVTSRSRMIVVTSPGNPTGVTASADVMDELADLAKSRDLVLVLDETYRTFRADRDAPAHRLFRRPDWPEFVVSLHSFSKDFAIPGHRVGAVVGSPRLLDEAAKLMDCVAICAPRIGQEAALEGLRSAKSWREEKATEAAAKHERLRMVMEASPGGFDLRLSGGFYGWIQHPDSSSGSDDIVRRLALRCGVLAVPGRVFSPGDANLVRISFANLELDQIDALRRRLEKF